MARVTIPGAPRIENYTLLESATFDRSYLWQEDGAAIDLTGATAVLKFSATKGGSAIITPSVTLGLTNGFIDYTVTPANITTLIAAAPSGGYFDLLITLSNGKVKRVVQGAFIYDKAA